MEKSEIKGFIAKRCAKELKNGNHEQDTQCPHEIHCFCKTPKVVFLLHNRKI